VKEKDGEKLTNAFWTLQNGGKLLSRNEDEPQRERAREMFPGRRRKKSAKKGGGGPSWDGECGQKKTADKSEFEKKTVQQSLVSWPWDKRLKKSIKSFGGSCKKK